MVSDKKFLITGGSGFLGSQLAQKLIDFGREVRVLDINKPELNGKFEYIGGDIRDYSVCLAASEDVDVVMHNVAQVPLAKNPELFRTVNIEGASNILRSAQVAGVKKFVMTSSSAVFGLPTKLPANNYFDLNPIEDYGKAKLAAENLMLANESLTYNKIIVRPRTILGPGRLGLFSILFDWISNNVDIFVFDQGQSQYQFIHSEDLVHGLINASNTNGSRIYNLGSLSFNSLRDDLQSLIDYANSESKIRSIPSSLVRGPLLATSKLGLVPFASYQILLYSQEMYFDSVEDWSNLHYQPIFSNSESLISSYEWFIKNQQDLRTNPRGSQHQRITKGVSLSLYKALSKVFSNL